MYKYQINIFYLCSKIENRIIYYCLFKLNQLIHFSRLKLGKQGFKSFYLIKI